MQPQQSVSQSPLREQQTAANTSSKSTAAANRDKINPLTLSLACPTQTKCMKLKSKLMVGPDEGGGRFICLRFSTSQRGEEAIAAVSTAIAKYAFFVVNSKEQLIYYGSDTKLNFGMGLIIFGFNFTLTPYLIVSF